MRFVRIKKSDTVLAGTWPAFKIGNVWWVFGPEVDRPDDPHWFDNCVNGDHPVFVPQPPGIIVGGKRADGHLFVAVKDSRGRAIIKAGCRSFSFEDGYSHWGQSRDDRTYTSWVTGKMTNIDAWSRRCLQRMEKEARRRRWKI